MAGRRGDSVDSLLLVYQTSRGLTRRSRRRLFAPSDRTSRGWARTVGVMIAICLRLFVHSVPAFKALVRARDNNFFLGMDFTWLDAEETA